MGMPTLGYIKRRFRFFGTSANQMSDCPYSGILVNAVVAD
jgi:hypothetical protein